ncbi:MAG: glutaredoxin family protein [Syntrophobacteraceae bacterium]
MKDCNVKLYTLSTCIHCKNTKEFLTECGVGYECIDVDKLDAEQRQAILEEVRQLNPNCSFPTIIIGDKIIVGFKKEEIREALDL